MNIFILITGNLYSTLLSLSYHCKGNLMLLLKIFWPLNNVTLNGFLFLFFLILEPVILYKNCRNCFAGTSVQYILFDMFFNSFWKKTIY